MFGTFWFRGQNIITSGWFCPFATCWAHTRFFRSCMGHQFDKVFSLLMWHNCTSTDDRRVAVSVWQASVKFVRYSRTDACVDTDPKTQWKDLFLGQYTDIFFSGTPIIKINWSWNTFIFLMGIPVLVNRYLYIETAPDIFHGDRPCLGYIRNNM